MSSLPRWFLCAIAAPTLLFGALSARPDWAARAGLDVWILPEATQQIEQGQRDLDRVDEASVRALGRIDTRQGIADEVILGRLGLVEAADRFHALNAGLPDGGHELRLCFAGASSDNECCCRQVISWVRTRLEETCPDEADGVVARLEEELQAHLSRIGAARPGQ
jgi:hypothetical protein